VKIKVNAIEECTTLFEIEVRKETVDQAFEEVYDEIVKVANIPGFRAGKAPKDLVKKHYEKDAREEVLKRIIPEAYRKALEEHKITPIGLPEISEVSFGVEKPLTFKAKIDTRPNFKLKNYKGMKVEKKKAGVTDEEAAKTLQNLREINAKYIDAEDRPVQMGDYAVSDVECFVDGKSVQKKRENLWLFIDKDSLIPGLSEKIVGMKRGEEKDLEVMMPEKYPDKNIAGKLAAYHVKVKEIKLRKLAELNDEFAKDLNKESLEALKKEIAKELEARSKVNAEMEAENRLLGKLMDDNVFSVPSSFVKRQMDFMVEDAKRRLQDKGFRKEELDKKDSEFREKFKNDAPRQVRLLFILDEIANNENIEVKDGELETSYASIAAQTGKTPEEVKNYYEKEEIVDNLKDKIREEKAIKFLLENAQVTEI
jgi:trigger factor